MPRFGQVVFGVLGVKFVGIKGLILLLLRLVTNLSLILFFDFLDFTRSLFLCCRVVLVFLVFFDFFLEVVFFLRLKSFLPSHRIRLRKITPPKKPPQPVLE